MSDPVTVIVAHHLGKVEAVRRLKEGLGRRRVTPDKIWRFAQHARVWSVMRPYVEAVVPDGA